MANEERPQSADRSPTKRAASGPFVLNPLQRCRLALARLETRIALADHEDLAATTHDLAVTMALLCGLEGRKHFHWNASQQFLNAESAEL
jgi:hypothetical protein